mmetsp:Transcript_6860/g.10036  ORF Transcript_6860/g.10036 Transcript_6860/m.10036 type:complete len:112 (+) Transcript_6860:224-559(+)
MPIQQCCLKRTLGIFDGNTYLEKHLSRETLNCSVAISLRIANILIDDADTGYYSSPKIAPNISPRQPQQSVSSPPLDSPPPPPKLDAAIIPAVQKAGPRKPSKSTDSSALI